MQLSTWYFHLNIAGTCNGAPDLSPKSAPPESMATPSLQLDDQAKTLESSLLLASSDDPYPSSQKTLRALIIKRSGANHSPPSAPPLPGSQHQPPAWPWLPLLPKYTEREPSKVEVRLFPCSVQNSATTTAHFSHKSQSPQNGPQGARGSCCLCSLHTSILTVP